MEDEIFIKNVLSVTVDGRKNVNKYTIKSMYDIRREDSRGSWYETAHKIIDEVTLPWSEIDALGGPGEVTRWLKDRYNIV